MGEHRARTADEKRRKKEAFVALHRLETFEVLQTLLFPRFDKNFVSVSRDQESGVLFACEYGPDVVALRITNNRLVEIQHLKGVHTDYPFQVLARGPRVFTCSLSQGLSSLEFPPN